MNSLNCHDALRAIPGDACDLFGDVAAIRHKFEVLDHRCEAFGRDPTEITKTRLGGLAIVYTSAEAERKWVPDGQRGGHGGRSLPGLRGGR